MYVCMLIGSTLVQELCPQWYADGGESSGKAQWEVFK